MPEKTEFSEFSDNYPLNAVPETIDFTRFFKGYCRNGESPIQGIDTNFLCVINDLSFVEMGKARNRALTHSLHPDCPSYRFTSRNGRSPKQGIDTIHYALRKIAHYVEMREARNRALTHSFRRIVRIFLFCRNGKSPKQGIAKEKRNAGFRRKHKTKKESVKGFRITGIFWQALFVCRMVSFSFFLDTSDFQRFSGSPQGIAPEDLKNYCRKGGIREV